MSKKRDRHLLALESEEKEHQINMIREKFEEQQASRAVIGSGMHQRPSRKHDGCVWVLLRNFVLAPLLLIMIVFLAKACFGG